MPLYLCLRFHRLPLQCLTLNSEQPTAVIEQHVVVCCNDSADEVGIRPGQSTATARALASELVPLARDTQREQQLMAQLCQWAYGITPQLQTVAPHCLLLDIGGSLRLFGGLQRLLSELQSALQSRHLDYQLAVAPSPKAACLLSLSQLATPYLVESSAALREALMPLPLNWLPDHKAAVDALHKAGIRHFSELLALPSAAIRARCGESFSRYLAQLLCLRSDPIAQYQPPPRFFDQHHLGYGLVTLDELLPSLHALLQSLCHFLRSTQMATRTLHWTLGDEHALRHGITVSSSRAHSVVLEWLQLTQLRLETVTLRKPVDIVQLQADQLEPLAAQTGSELFALDSHTQPLHYLTDRLRSRLGQQALQHIGEREAHLPESVLTRGSEAHRLNGVRDAEITRRPFWLLQQPQPLSRSAQGLPQWQGPLQLLTGPERIEDGWWQQPVSRDYYVAKSPSAGPCWIYRDRHSDMWYLHGLFV